MNKIANTPRRMKNQPIILSEGEKAILYYRYHPVEAARDLLGVELHWIQRKTLRAIWYSQYICAALGRRNGKTRVGAIAVVLYAILYPRTRNAVITVSKRQNDWIFKDDIGFLYVKSPYFKASCSKGGPKVSNMGNRIDFYNGSVIEGISVGNTKGIRGLGVTGILWIDEYAFVDKPVIDAVIKPFTAVKEKDKRPVTVFVSSSAYYKWNHFWSTFVMYKIQSAITSKYITLNYNYIDVNADKRSPYYISDDVVADAKATMTHHEFQCEYLAVFPDESEGAFSAKLIDDCTPREPKEVEVEMKGDGSEYTVGVDAGRRRSNFAMTVLKIIHGAPNKVVKTVTLNNKPFQDMIREIRLACYYFPVTRIHIGQGGGGLTLKDLLAEPWPNPYTNKEDQPILDMDDPDHRDKPGLKMLRLINEVPEKHNSLFMTLKSEMEHKNILFPLNEERDENPDIERVKQDIVALKRELQVMTATPKGRFLNWDVPSEFKGGKDRAVSLVMAIDAYLDRYRTYQPPDDDLAVGFYVV